MKAEVAATKAEVATTCAKHGNVKAEVAATKAEVATACAKHGNVKAEVAATKAEVATRSVAPFDFAQGTLLLNFHHPCKI
ncbi:hypothetical protein [Nostoc sp.]|uniref:hypothetical protein n=1 Tax=Nostoc sp. TaxID=1180 RepID=UPI002FFB9D92